MSDGEDIGVVDPEEVREELLEVTLPDSTGSDDFLKVRETLTRIGNPYRGDRLQQVCYLYHDKGRYYICHYRELAILFDGSTEPVTEDDYDTRDMVAHWLSKWGLLDLVNPEIVENIEKTRVKNLRVVKHADKDDWVLVKMFVFGPSRRR